MVMLSHGSGSWMPSLKVLLLSAGALSMALVFKVSLPAVTEFATTQVPLLWSLLNSCLEPPYLYLVINCIIISIVASSKFQQKADHAPLDTVAQPLTIKLSGDLQTDYAEAYGALRSNNLYSEIPPETRSDNDVHGVVDDKVLSEEKTTRTVNELATLCTDKPPVSARFGHRKAVKTSPEGTKTLGVSKSKRQDTLESTWRMITDGRQVPLTRHLRKSDTWETHGPHANADQSPQMKKSETYHSRGVGGPGKLRKEASLSQDELNRRVEAFIRKFNEEMRLQRQESLEQFMEMINRGAH